MTSKRPELSHLWAIHRSFVSIRRVIQVRLDRGRRASQPARDLGGRESLVIAIVTRQRDRPSALLHAINGRHRRRRYRSQPTVTAGAQRCHPAYDQDLGFGCPAGEPEHMRSPATRNPCDIARQDRTLLVFVFGITSPRHRPDAAVKAELIPTRPRASACSSAVNTPSSRSCGLVAEALVRKSRTNS